MVVTTPVDAGGMAPAVVAPVFDAAPVAIAADGPDPRMEIRAKLADLAQQHDWSAILTLSDLESGDPEVATVLADAKKNYTAQQLDMIGGYVARGDCTHAKTIAGVSAKLAPDSAAAFDAKAARCTQHVRPAGPGPVSDLDTADDAYDKQDYPKALTYSEKVLAKDPKNEEALRQAALAACSAGNAEKANVYVPQAVGAKERGVANLVCKKNDVVLAKPVAQPKPPPLAKPPTAPLDIGKTISSARSALDMGRTTREPRRVRSRCSQLTRRSSTSARLRLSWVWRRVISGTRRSCRRHSRTWRSVART